MKKKRTPAPAPARPRSSRSRRALYAAVLVVAGAAAYLPGLSHPFLFDDQTAIVNNATIRSLTPISTVLSPPRDTPVAGRPIVNLSLAVSYASNGLEPRGYRLGNLAIHLAAGLVLLITVRRLLALPRLAALAGESATPLAFATAMLWTLHPLSSEVVYYVTQRTESLMALAYLLTIYFSVRAIGDRRPRWTVAAVVSCAAGMLCKESMVFPVVFDSWRDALRTRSRLYAGLAATWVVLLAVLLSTPRTSVGFEAGTSSWTYLLNQARLVPRYFQLAVWPRALVMDYGLPQPLMVGDVWLPALFVVVLIALTVAALVFRPLIGLAATWMFITLAPTSSIVPIATEVGAERRMYLPLVGFVLLVVMVAWHAMQVLWRRRLGGSTEQDPPYGVPDPGGSTKQDPPYAIGAGVLAVIAALMVAGVVVRGQEYASQLTMAQTIVDRWPNGRGHFMLGTALIEAGQHAAGMAQLRESERDYPGALFAIGTEQLGAGEFTAGIDTLKRFIAALPNHVNVIAAHEMLSRAYASQQNLSAARQEAEIVVRTAPRYAVGHDLLGRILAGQGQFAAAAAEFRTVLALTPGDPEARRNLETMQRLAAGPPAAAPSPSSEIHVRP